MNDSSSSGAAVGMLPLSPASDFQRLSSGKRSNASSCRESGLRSRLVKRSEAPRAGSNQEELVLRPGTSMYRIRESKRSSNVFDPRTSVGPSTHMPAVPTLLPLE